MLESAKLIQSKLKFINMILVQKNKLIILSKYNLLAGAVRVNTSIWKKYNNYTTNELIKNKMTIWKQYYLSIDD